jgi:spore germination cell wall hydrolase CwlJ-like protein
MRVLLVLLGSLLSTLAAAQSEVQCKAIAVHVESRGESLKASRGVLQVILNRNRITGKTACEVVKAPGQFPWAANRRNWKLSRNVLTRYFKVVNMLPTVSTKTYYFNHVPVTYGKQHKKIGKLYFNLKEQ